MRTIPLGVLFHEGPQGRAYLAALRRAGLRPARALQLVLARHPATGRAVGRWLPGSARRWLAAQAQDVALNAWPRRLRRERPELVEAIARALAPEEPAAEALLAELAGRFPLAEYAAEVEPLLVEGVRDPRLAAALAARPGTWLFTGGGLLPRAAVEAPGVTLLHVHPGLLPHVRGADGLLWSLLVRGRPGASCFVMDAGLDTGALLAAEELAPLRIELAGPRPSDEALYRAVFAFLDPLLRARLLVRHVLEPAGGDPLALPRRPQDPATGRTYPFLHPRLRARALALLFAGGRAAGSGAEPG